VGETLIRVKVVRLIFVHLFIKILVMQKNILVILILTASALFSQENKVWRFGLQWGFQGNQARQTGGMEEANARFGNDDAGGGAINLLARYDHDTHWMVSSGLGIQTFGFRFSLSQNYSLKNPESRYATSSSEFSALEIPLMIHYKFNPNCRQAKWVIGAGLVHGLIGKQTINGKISQGAEASLNENYLTSTAKVNEGLYGMLRLSAGRERTLKKGRIIAVNFILNLGFRDLAQAHVEYKIDGVNYNHDFATDGNFLGFRISYYLRPIGQAL
jgi:hypothetical protein